MRFSNFSLPTSLNEVIVCAHDLKWDLHNLAEYSGMNVGTDGTVSLEWIVHPNPHRPHDKRFAGCAFIFRDLKMLKVSGRDVALPKTEDITLHGISRVLPTDLSPYLISKKKNDWTLETDFHLLFEFRGGLSIIIDADEVEFLTRN